MTDKVLMLVFFPDVKINLKKKTLQIFSEKMNVALLHHTKQHKNSIFTDDKSELGSVWGRNLESLCEPL